MAISSWTSPSGSSSRTSSTYDVVDYHGPILDEQNAGEGMGEGRKPDHGAVSPRRIHPDFGVVNFVEFGRRLMQSATEPAQDFSTIVSEEWRKLPEADQQFIDGGTVVHAGPEPAQPRPMMEKMVEAVSTSSE